MYPFSKFEQFTSNPWYGFDLIAGIFKNNIGAENTVILFEITFICLFFTAIILNIRDTEEEKKYLSIYILLAIFLTSYCLGRITLIRPTILIAIITLLCLKGRSSISGFIITVFSAFLYYLFFVFFIPLAVAHYLKGSKRFAVGIASGVVVSLIVWIYNTDYEYFKVLWFVLSGLLFDRDGIRISENIISLSLIGSQFVFLLLFFFIATVLSRLKVDIYIVLIVLTIPIAIQLRYFIDITIPLMFLYTVKNSEFIEKVMSNNTYRKLTEISVLISLVLLIPALSGRAVENGVSLEDINLPKGSVVFSDSMSIAFSTIYWNKELVRVLPAAEIGWNDTETKKILKRINEDKKVDEGFCNYAKKYGITYLLTSHPVNGDCFNLLRTFNKGIRVELFSIK